MSMCGRFVADRRTVLRIPLRQLVAGDAEGIKEDERRQAEGGVQLGLGQVLKAVDDHLVRRGTGAKSDGQIFAKSLKIDDDVLKSALTHKPWYLSRHDIDRRTSHEAADRRSRDKLYKPPESEKADTKDNETADE